ncbi:hypothetical protein CLV84_4229 [Neolewinella xylanilytica]|uniref:Uncharacterized protein n=1 Tax=Neolewinella xylanilytica TaxID=1514080 RepID=A0A2S6HZX3_9BACT|nr:hypothetical protein [Neolewinella xylanilytica]PPK84079.1 hypothetical protein CLV84_4229 [Neolewinella xylanilytica]
MFNKHSSSNRRPHRTDNPLPEVADTPTGPCDSDSLGDVAAFKVLLKRNLRHQAPPADLIGKIRGRIEEIKAQD